MSKIALLIKTSTPNFANAFGIAAPTSLPNII